MAWPSFALALLQSENVPEPRTCFGAIFEVFVFSGMAVVEEEQSGGSPFMPWSDKGGMCLWWIDF